MRKLLYFALLFSLLPQVAFGVEKADEGVMPPELIKLIPLEPKKAAKKKSKAKPTPKKKLIPFELTNLFSVDENPGSGALLFTRGSIGQEVKLGKEFGNNGYGLVFRSDNLPQPHRYEFHGKKIVQIALGAVEAGNKLSQIGSMSLLLDVLPEKRTAFKILDRSQRGLASKKEQGALALFVSPDLKKEATEQERLMNTWFAHSGALTVITKSAIKKSTAVYNSRRLEFAGQLVEINVDVQMATPFNPTEKSNLEGKIVLPIYWPANAAAQELTDELAALSLDDSK